MRILWRAFAGSPSAGSRSAVTAAAAGEVRPAVTLAATYGSAATRSAFSSALGGSSPRAPAGPSTPAATCSSTIAGDSKSGAVYSTTHEFH